MRNKILKNFNNTITSIIAFLIITIGCLLFTITFKSWFPIIMGFIIIFLCFISSCNMDYFNMFYKIYVDHTGIKLYLFSKEKLFIAWDEISSIEKVKPNSAFTGVQLRISSKDQKSLDIDYREKLKNLLSTFCPYKDLLNALNNPIKKVKFPKEEPRN